MQSHSLLFSLLEELRNRERSLMENQNAEFDHLGLVLGLKNSGSLSGLLEGENRFWP